MDGTAVYYTSLVNQPQLLQPPKQLFLSCVFLYKLSIPSVYPKWKLVPGLMTPLHYPPIYQHCGASFFWKFLLHCFLRGTEEGGERDKQQIDTQVDTFISLVISFGSKFTLFSYENYLPHRFFAITFQSMKYGFIKSLILLYEWDGKG